MNIVCGYHLWILLGDHCCILCGDYPGMLWAFLSRALCRPLHLGSGVLRGSDLQYRRVLCPMYAVWVGRPCAVARCSNAANSINVVVPPAPAGRKAASCSLWRWLLIRRTQGPNGDSIFPVGQISASPRQPGCNQVRLQCPHDPPATPATPRTSLPTVHSQGHLSIDR